MASPTARRALLGDWNRWVRDPLDVMRLAFVAGLVWFAAHGDVKGTFNLAVAVALVALARAIQLPRVYDLAVIVAMTFTMVGEALGLYDSWAWYDRLVHVVVPLLAAQVLYIALARIEVLHDLRDETATRHHLGIFVVTAALGIAVGDLIADTAGSLAGGALLVAYARFGWGSVRRIPGENRFEDVSS